MTLSHITKHFGATVAVDDVSLELAPGEVLGLVGENGAGKTTLMSIAAGELPPDRGRVERSGPAGMVHQHFMLVSEFTIAENLALALGRLLDARDADRLISETGIDLPGAQRRVSDLSVGEKAKLELIKAIVRRPAVLILDEPTAVLTPSESRELFDVIRRIAAAGTAIVFISHKIREVIEVAARIVVMRRGRIVAEGTGMTAEEVAAAMVPLTRPSATLSPPRGERVRGAGVRGVAGDLSVGSGEIVAIIGVAGNGQEELAASAGATARGRVARIPADRARDGIVAEMTIAENLALRLPRWRPREAQERAARLIERFDIRAQSPLQRAGTLSGGNQQKVLLARELDRHPDFIIASEPTRGLDIEATRFVHQQLRDTVARGAGILLITSDLDEAFALADAVHVIYRGKLSERLTPEEAAARAPALMAGVA